MESNRLQSERSATMISLLLLLAALAIAAGDYLFICLKPTIEAVEGDDILLQCRLDPSIDLTTFTVDWKRFNKVVHAYRHEQDLPAAQLDQYRGRTTLNHEDLKRGVVTLLISSAQLSDSGPYRCYVPKLKAGCTVDVTVVKKDQQNRTKRGDFSTSGPPVKPVTRPDNRDAAEMEAVSPKVVVGAVVGGILAAAVVGGVIFILVKRSSKRRQQEATKPDDSEMENLRTRTTEEDEDQHRAAENGLR